MQEVAEPIARAKLLKGVFRPPLARRHWDEFAAPQSSPYDRHIHDRLNGLKTYPHYLDSLQFYAAIRLTETIGAQMLFGEHTRIMSLTPADLLKAGNEGFKVVSRGVDGICEHLSTLTAQFWTASHNKFTQLYGSLYEWLRITSDPAVEPVKEVLRDHALHSLPRGEHDTFLGPIKTRISHSLHTAASHYGFGGKLLKSILHQLGVVNDDQMMMPTKRILINVADTQHVLEKLRTSMYPHCAAQLFGKLVNDGYIVPLVRKDWPNRVPELHCRAELDSIREKMTVPLEDNSDAPVRDWRMKALLNQAEERRTASSPDPNS